LRVTPVVVVGDALRTGVGGGGRGRVIGISRILNTNAGRRGRGRVYSVERQSAIDMIVKPEILGLRGIHDVFTVLVEDVHVIIVPTATDTVLVNKLMIMTILPHGPKLVDVVW
jgi:hypothetical protein